MFQTTNQTRSDNVLFQFFVITNPHKVRSPWCSRSCPVRVMPRGRKRCDNLKSGNNQNSISQIVFPKHIMIFWYVEYVFNNIMTWKSVSAFLNPSSPIVSTVSKPIALSSQVDSLKAGWASEAWPGMKTTWKVMYAGSRWKNEMFNRYSPKPKRVKCVAKFVRTSK